MQNEMILKRIFERTRRYSEKVGDILSEYETLASKIKTEGAMRKDEETFVEENTAKHTKETRGLLAKEAALFAQDIRNDAQKLRDQLSETLFRPLNTALVAQLDTVQKFKVKPTKLQIETMIQMNGGNLLGLQAIEAVLTETKADYSLKYHGVRDYEADLAAIEHLAASADHFVPMEHHQSGCEVYRGQNQVITRQDGTEYQTGFTWNGVGLLQRNANVRADVEKIDSMVQRWTADVSTEIMDKASAVFKAKVAEQAKAEGENADNTPDPESTVSVNDGADDTAIAATLGEQKAANSAAYNEAMSHYMR